MIPLDQLTTPMTEEQVLERFLSLLEGLGLPARSWAKAGALRSILRVVAIVYSQFTYLVASAIRAGFLDLAEGAWLTLHAYYILGVERKPATFATGEVTFTNSGGGIYSFTAEQVRVLWPISSTKKKAYVNTAAFTLNPGESKTIAVRAVEVGASSSAPPASITEMETVFAGVSCTNALAVWGQDEELDAELRDRCRDKPSSTSVGGPRGAYAFAAKSAKRLDGSYVNINRVAVSPSSSTGDVYVYCAAPAGAPSSGDLDYVRDNIEAIARPDGVKATTAAATNVPLSRSLILWARRTPGVDAAGIKTLAEKALEVEMRLYPIGGIAKTPATQGYLYADFIAAVAKGAHSSVFDVDGSGADLALDPGEVAVLSSTIEVRIVEAA